MHAGIPSARREVRSGSSDGQLPLSYSTDPTVERASDSSTEIAATGTDSPSTPLLNDAPTSRRSASITDARALPAFDGSDLTTIESDPMTDRHAIDESNCSLLDDVQDIQPTSPSSGDPSPPSRMTLQLEIDDREVIEALHRQKSSEARQAFALAALKIGVTALQVAQSRLDGDIIQRESSRLLEAVSHRLREHSSHVHDHVNSQLKEYFDPESGRFNERVKRLISHDGELEQVIRRQISSQDSELAKTLLNHVGENSPLMKRLNPNESEGLLAALRGLVEEQLKNQRERVLLEFSLDNPQGSLSRLVGELTRNHGELQRDLQAKINDVVKEFSLDQENSALSRLVRNVDAAQHTIVREFSLDNPESAFSRLNVMLRDTQGAIQGHLTLDDESSPLARIKRELTQLLRDHSRENGEFREEVKTALARLEARREEADRSTRHGLEFEQALNEFLNQEAQSCGDILTPTGTTTGTIKNSKVGDFVLELNPDSQASGAKIVLEAKQEAGITVAKAREEIATARKNRGAQVGIFVYSAKAAPENMLPFARYGDDLVVVWDAELPATDVYAKAAIATARALCVRVSKVQRDTTDFDAIERAVREIEKQAEMLDDIRKYADTIQSSGSKILDRVRISQQSLQKQVGTLDLQVKHWLARHGDTSSVDTSN